MYLQKRIFQVQSEIYVNSVIQEIFLKKRNLLDELNLFKFVRKKIESNWSFCSTTLKFHKTGAIQYIFDLCFSMLIYVDQKQFLWKIYIYIYICI